MESQILSSNKENPNKLEPIIEIEFNPTPIIKIQLNPEQNKEPLLSSISPSYNDQEFPDFKKVEDNTKDKEGDLKNDDMQTNKKIPYDLRNKSLEKMPNFYNEKIAESNFKNEYDFIISKKISNSNPINEINSLEQKITEVSKAQNLEKTGNCHICKKKKTVYGCYTQFKPASCSKLYCESCLFSVFNEKITEIIQKNAHWKCPFKKKICKCKHCLKNRENEKNGVSSNITSENKKIKSEKIEHQISQAQQYTRAKNVQKLKGFIEFNGNLMLKFSKSMKSLNAQEIMYYHNIIYESLKKLESIADYAETKNIFMKN